MNRSLFATGLFLLASVVISAQTADPTPTAAKARTHFGPLALTSTIDLTNLGVDTNVFNQTTAAGPKQDFTFTVVPKANLWMRMGRTWLIGTLQEDIVWYQQYSTERSLSNRYGLRWQAFLNRFTTEVAANYLRLRDRPGFEIDVRSLRREAQVSGSVETRLLPRTFAKFRVERATVDFDQDAVFLAKSLRSELNRSSITAGVTVNHQATPLTTIGVDLSRTTDRFAFSPLRDSNSTRLAGTIALDPFALIKGRATVGYRIFEPQRDGLPGFKGLTATGDLSAVVGSTRLNVVANRDISYSYEIDQPYYIQSGATGSVSQHIFGPIDLGLRIGVQRFDYRDRVGAVVLAANRVDYLHTYGGTFTYRLGNMRLSFNLDRQRRTSAIDFREYNGLRYGTAVTYAF